MTTFTTEDRIIAKKNGSFTVNVQGGTVTSSPPHIVDSGASVMIKELTDEEIEEVEKSCKKPLASWAWQVEFARAILRRAQEK